MTLKGIVWEAELGTVAFSLSNFCPAMWFRANHFPPLGLSFLVYGKALGWTLALLTFQAG